MARKSKRVSRSGIHKIDRLVTVGYRPSRRRALYNKKQWIASGEAQ